MQTQTLTGKAEQVTLRSLIQSRTTEEVRTPIQRLLASVQRENAVVITHRGKVLGFVVKSLPESLKHLETNAPTGALSQNLKIKALPISAAQGAVKVTYHGRHRVWFVSPQYQDDLQLLALE